MQVATSGCAAGASCVESTGTIPSAIRVERHQAFCGPYSIVVRMAFARGWTTPTIRLRDTMHIGTRGGYPARCCGVYGRRNYDHHRASVLSRATVVLPLRGG